MHEALDTLAVFRYRARPMSAIACEAGLSASTGDAKPTPFSQQWVTLSKQEHIELLMQARSWKSMHERAVQRNEWLQAQLRRQHQQAEQREAALRSELELARAKNRDLQQRLYGRKTEHGRAVDSRLREHSASPRPCGQQRGTRARGCRTCLHARRLSNSTRRSARAVACR